MIGRIARWLFVTALPFLAFTASIGWLVNSPGLYMREFAKHGVPQAMAQAGLPVTEAQLEDIAQGFVRYFNSSEELIDLSVPVDGQTVPLFTDDEALHFRDVKALVRLDYVVLAATFAYCLLYAAVCLLWHKGSHHRLLARAALTGGLATFGVMALLGVVALVDFDAFWLVFHLVSFSNELWSVTGYMLVLFPGGFWYDMVIRVAVVAAGIAVAVGGLGGGYLLLRRRKEMQQA